MGHALLEGPHRSWFGPVTSFHVFEIITHDRSTGKTCGAKESSLEEISCILHIHVWRDGQECGFVVIGVCNADNLDTPCTPACGND